MSPQSYAALRKALAAEIEAAGADRKKPHDGPYHKGICDGFYDGLKWVEAYLEGLEP